MSEIGALRVRARLLLSGVCVCVCVCRYMYVFDIYIYIYIYILVWFVCAEKCKVHSIKVSFLDHLLFHLLFFRLSSFSFLFFWGVLFSNPNAKCQTNERRRTMKIQIQKKKKKKYISLSLFSVFFFTLMYNEYRAY